MYKALTSDKEIDPDKFQGLCDSWKNLYFDPESDVSWYKICPSVHRILEHAADSMRVLPVPVGLTTEECTEAITEAGTITFILISDHILDHFSKIDLRSY
jgi:hypothetical protein